MSNSLLVLLKALARDSPSGAHAIRLRILRVIFTAITQTVKPRRRHFVVLVNGSKYIDYIPPSIEKTRANMSPLQ